MRVRLLPTLVSFIALFQFGCYNTYNVNLKEFNKIQESDNSTFKTIKTEDGQTLTVTENSLVGVIDGNNKYHPVTPFNFTLSELQLVAPDDDLLLPRPNIQSANIKLINPTSTTLLVSSVLLVLVGAAVAIVLSEEECTGNFCK